MATNKDRPLEDEETYFIRGMWTLEVCVDVLWDAVKRSEVDLVEWWEKHIKTLKQNSKQPKELKQWQIQSIDADSPEKWDISVLSFAIRNCAVLRNEEHENLRECAKKLNDMRSDCLCHERKARIAFDKYIRILQTSMKCFKKLIAEKEGYMKFVEQLENITKHCIRDQKAESWLTLLTSREERMMRGCLTEEELRDIHADLIAKAKESISDVKQRVAVEQQQQQQQNMQATNIAGVTLIQNFYGTEAQTPKPPQAGAQTPGIIGGTDTSNTMPKEEMKPSGGNSASESDVVNPIIKLNEYYQKHSLERPKYKEQKVDDQFICTVSFQGESFEARSHKSKNDAKQAAAQMVVDRFKL